ncbi:MAG: helicase-related protein [Alphaproteobacteria bacterium]
MSTQDELQAKVVKQIKDFFSNHVSIGYIDLAMRFGKCKVVIDLLKTYHYNPKIFIAYPDNKLQQTWIDEMNLWGYDMENVLFVNFSSLKHFRDSAFDFFIIDEFHAASPLEREYCRNIIDASCIALLLSGTVSEETKKDWGYPCIAKYTTLEGIDDGILANYLINVHLVDLDTKIYTEDKKGKRKTEKQRYDAYTWVIEKLKQDGDNFMYLALARNRLSLSSIAKKEYTLRLLEKLKDKRVLVFTGLSKAADSLGIPSYHSKSKEEGVFTAFKEGTINQLALAAIGKVGVTYPNLDSVILTNFTYNAEETSQILNRAIKLDYKDKIADLHILCLNEPAELKKLKESLSMLDSTKINYFYNGRQIQNNRST